MFSTTTTTATLFALLTLGANALKVTSPSDTSVWKSTDLNQELKWESVSSDATSFAVVLVNMVSAPRDKRGVRAIASGTNPY